MANDGSRMSDAFQIAIAKPHTFKGETGMVGYGVVELRGPDGALKHVEPFANLITTRGDQYYAKRGMAGVSPATPSDETNLADGMKLGTDGTAASKSTAATSYISTGHYISGSNNAFDSTYPQLVDEAGDGGYSIQYKTTWGAGDATNSGIQEAAIVTSCESDAGETDATTTVARVTFTSVNKGANDTLAITWSHKFLGA